METNCVIFDYGSVLVGWNPDTLLERIFPEEKERQAFTEILNRDFIPTVDIQNDLSWLVEQFSAEYPAWSHAVRLYRRDWTDMLGPEIAGMTEVISALRDAGYRTCGLTNWNRETFDRSREIRPIMQQIQEPDLVVSGDIFLGKPDPAIYRYALQRFRKKPKECVFVDDKASNVAAAIRCGMKGVVFKGAEDLKAQLRHHGITF